MKNKLEFMKLPNHIQFETVSQATKLLEKRRMLYEVHEAYEQQKEEFTRQEEGLRKQEDIIRDTDLKIQESLIKFCKSLIDNENKKARAIRRYEEEYKARKSQEKKIDEENESIHNLEGHTKTLEKKVDSLKRYEEFLNGVISSNQDLYVDLNELLQRHKILEKSRKNLQEKNIMLQQKRDEAIRKKNSDQKEKMNQILILGNENANKKKLQDNLEAERHRAQSEIDNSKKQVYSKMLDLGKM